MDATNRQRALTFLIYLKVTTVMVAPELFITFRSLRDSLLNPSDANELQMQMQIPPASFPKSIPHKTVNHCIPWCQVIDTSVTKWDGNQDKRKALHNVENSRKYKSMPPAIDRS